MSIFGSNQPQTTFAQKKKPVAAWIRWKIINSRIYKSRKKILFISVIIFSHYHDDEHEYYGPLKRFLGLNGD